MVKVGNVQSERGKLVKGYLAVGSLADGNPIELPIMIASGEEEGKTIWINGCIHGSEHGGAVAIIKFMNSLDLKTLKGTIVAVPVVNILAFRDSSRATKLDGVNLNRVFPGERENSYTYQLASLYFETVCKQADYHIDLHSGGTDGKVPFYSGFFDNGTNAAETANQMCRNCGSAVIWRVKGETQGEVKGEGNLGGVLSAQLVNKGIPSVVIECGGGTVYDEDINNYLTAINGIMKGLHMLPGEPPVQGRYTIISGGIFLNNKQGGIFMPECKAGDIVQKGEILGKIVNLYGETVEVLEPPADRVYIASMKLPNTPISTGDSIGEAVTLIEEE